MNALIAKLVEDRSETSLKEALRLLEQDEPINPDEWEVDPEVVNAMMQQIGGRFKEERIKGFTHPETGHYMPPVPSHEAEARWTGAEPVYRGHFAQMRYNPDLQRRFNLFRRRQQQQQQQQLQPPPAA